MDPQKRSTLKSIGYYFGAGYTGYSLGEGVAAIIKKVSNPARPFINSPEYTESEGEKNLTAGFQAIGTSVGLAAAHKLLNSDHNDPSP